MHNTLESAARGAQSRRMFPLTLRRQGAALAAGAAAGAGAVLYGVLAPFGPGLALGAAEDRFLAVCAGAALGVVLRYDGVQAVAMLSALAACAAVRWARPRRFGPACAACCGVWALAMLLMELSGAATPAQLLCTCIDVLLCAGYGYALRRWPADEGGAGALLVGAVLVAAAANLPLGPFEAGAFLAALAGLTLGCRGRLKEAAVAAIVLSTALCAARPALGFAAAALCCGTLCTAVFCPGEKLRSAAVFWLGCLPGAFCAAQQPAALRFLGALLAAEAVFLLLPPKWVLAVPPADPAESAARPVISSAATRLSAVAESLSGIAQTVDGVYQVLPHKGETYNWVVDCTHDELCFNCGRREECWQKQYSTTVDGLFALKPILEQQGRVGVEDLPGQLCRCIHPAALSSTVTRAFALYRGRREARVHADALRSALTEQYGAVADALAGLSAQLGEPGVPEQYKSGRVAALFASLGLEPLECAVTQDGVGRLRAAVTLPRASFTPDELKDLAGEVGRICRRPIDEPQKLSCRNMTTLIFNEKPVFCPQFGMAGHAAAGDVSGDAVQQFCAAGTAQMILCDGMGTGRPAAVDGNLAAELTARLLKAGFTPETAARLVNVALALKSDEESGATLDLVSVDLYTGVASLYKAGAAPGFVVHGGQVRTVGEASLPVGILGAVNGESRKVHLTAGDWVVLVSDGMLVDGPEWIAQQLKLSADSGDTPGALAALLVKTARARAESAGRPDDITAAALKLTRVL